MMVVAMIVVDICHLTGLKQISDRPTSRDDNLRIMNMLLTRVQ